MSKLKYFDGTNWKIVNGQITGDTLPIGSIIPYTSENAPTGWLVCIGQTLNKTTYPELFDVIGYTFGGEEGGDTFNLPNLKGRVIVGQDTSQTEFEDIGQTGGSKYIQDHYHEYKFGSSAGGDGSGLAYSSTTGTQPNKAAIQGVKGVTTGNSGNLQPYMVTNYIIKVKQSAGLVGGVVNTQSDSTTDTYSCDYINEAVLDNYSADEQEIGVWYNGDTLYRKYYYISALGNTTTTYTALNITNLKEVVKASGMASNGSTFFPLPCYRPDNTLGIQMYVDNINGISITTGNDRSGYHAYIVIEYTKTTD